MAEWARLLSECRVKPVAGSNPALPATKNALGTERIFDSHKNLYHFAFKQLNKDIDQAAWEGANHLRL